MDVSSLWTTLVNTFEGGAASAVKKARQQDMEVLDGG